MNYMMNVFFKNADIVQHTVIVLKLYSIFHFGEEEINKLREIQEYPHIISAEKTYSYSEDE